MADSKVLNTDKKQSRFKRAIAAIFAPSGRVSGLALLSAMAFAGYFLRPAWQPVLDGSRGIYWPAMLPGVLGAYVATAHLRMLAARLLDRAQGRLRRYGEDMFTAAIGLALTIYGITLFSPAPGGGVPPAGGIAIVTSGIESLTINALEVGGSYGADGEFLQVELTGQATSDRPYIALISSGPVRIDGLGVTNGLSYKDEDGSVSYISRLIEPEPDVTPFTVGPEGIELSPGRVSIGVSAPWFDASDYVVHVVDLPDRTGPFTARVVARTKSIYTRTNDSSEGDLLQIGCASDLFTRSYHYNGGVGLPKLVRLDSRPEVVWSVPSTCAAHLIVGEIRGDGELRVAGKTIDGRHRIVRVDAESQFPANRDFAAGSTTLTVPDTAWRFVSADALDRRGRGDIWAGIWIALGLPWLGAGLFGLYRSWHAPRPKRAIGFPSS